MPTKTLSTKIVSQTTPVSMVTGRPPGRRAGRAGRRGGRRASAACRRRRPARRRLAPRRRARRRRLRVAVPSIASRVGSWTIAPSWVTQLPATISSSKSGAKTPSPSSSLRGHQGDQVDDVLGVELRGRAGHLARHVAPAPHLGVADPDDLAGDRALDVAAGLGGEVDDDRAGLHLLDHLAGDQHRRLAAGHGGGGDQRVGGGDVRREQLALPGRAVLGHLAGVAAGALEGLEVEVDGLGAHRPDLLGGGRAHVVGPDDRAEPLGRRDRLQAGDAGAEHDDLGGLDGAGRGHVQREEAAQHPGRDDRAAVAGDQRLGAQRVHRLGARDARDQLHARAVTPASRSSTTVGLLG